MLDLSISISDRFRPALETLLTAYDYAVDSQTDPWQFAVPLSDLVSAGASISDIRWLLLRNFAQHARETTIPGDTQRSFRILAPTCLPSDACVSLTSAGALAIRGTAKLPITPATHLQSLEQIADANATLAVAPACILPEWDATRRELRYAGEVVKRYRVPAENQALILSAFQEEGWPEFIDDPLPPEDGLDPKQRLQATVKSLNRNQLSPIIRFHGNGNGLQVYWEPI